MADTNTSTVNKGIVLDGSTIAGSSTAKASTVATVAQDATRGHGIKYLAANPENFEIQRSNNFAFYVDLSDITTSNSTYFSAGTNNQQQILELACSKAFVPHFKQEVITVKRGNNAIKFAGAATFDSGSISVRDYIGTNIKDLLMAWQRKSYNLDTEKVGLASDYKRQGTLVEYTPDYQVVRTWNLYGCWISAITEGEYSHDSNDVKSIDVTIEYDYAKVDAQWTQA